MQIGAINSVGFKGNDILLLPAPKADFDSSKNLNSDNLIPDEILDDVYTMKSEPAQDVVDFDSDDSEYDKKLTGDKLRNYIDVAQRSKENVRLLTIVSSFALCLGLMNRCNKIAKPVARAFVTAGETISNGAVRIAGKVFKNVDTEKVTNRIKTNADKLRSDAPDQKMLDGIKSFVDKIFVSDKTKKAVENEVVTTSGDNVLAVMKKLGLQNKADILRGVGVSAVALSATDKFADKIEGRLDKAEVDRAKKDLIGDGFGVAAELVNAVM